MSVVDGIADSLNFFFMVRTGASIFLHWTRPTRNFCSSYVQFLHVGCAQYKLDNTLVLISDAPLDVQLRFDGWVTELADMDAMKDVKGDLSDGKAAVHPLPFPLSLALFLSLSLSL